MKKCEIIAKRQLYRTKVDNLALVHITKLEALTHSTRGLLLPFAGENSSRDEPYNIIMWQYSD